MSDFTDFDAQTEPSECHDCGQEIWHEEFVCDTCAANLCSACEPKHNAAAHFGGAMSKATSPLTEMTEAAVRKAGQALTRHQATIRVPPEVVLSLDQSVAALELIRARRVAPLEKAEKALKRLSALDGPRRGDVQPCACSDCQGFYQRRDLIARYLARYRRRAEGD